MTGATASWPEVRAAVSPVDAASFHRLRPRLFGIAYRVVGNRADADDIVQDTWVRWQTTDRSKVRDAAAFLSTTTTRLAINLMQSARVRRVTALGPWRPEAVDADADPARLIERDQAVDLAVLTLLERLMPGERGAYLLREAFGYPYRDIATVLGVGEANARQLVRRARKNLDGERRHPVRDADQCRMRDAFLAAAETGDLAMLEELLASAMAARPESRPPVSQVALLAGLGC